MVAFKEEDYLTPEQIEEAQHMAEVAEGAYGSVSTPQLALLLNLSGKNNDVIRSMAEVDGCPYAFKKLLFAQLASQLALLGTLCLNDEDELNYAVLVPFMASVLQDRVMEDGDE